MPNFSIDPRYLAPMATSIGVMVSIYLWLLNQRKKQLSYRILANHPLVNYTEETRGRIDLRFDGNRVQDAQLAVIKIENNGHLPIEAKDYEARLALHTAAGTKILMAQVSETQPLDLGERVRDDSGIVPIIQQVEERKIILRPVLLNSGDSITVQILLDHAAAKLSVAGHIHGVSSIRKAQDSRLAETLMTCLGVILMVGAMVFITPDSFLYFAPEEILPVLLIFLIGCVLLYIGRHLAAQRQTRRQHLFNAQI